MPPGVEPFRPPRWRRQERPDPNEDLLVDDAAIVRVMDMEDGPHLLARDVLGRDYVRLMRLRMEANSNVQRGETRCRCFVCYVGLSIECCEQTTSVLAPRVSAGVRKQVELKLEDFLPADAVE